jgi:hypothetical protein
MKRKEHGTKRSLLKFKILSWHCQEKLRKTTESLDENSRSPGQDFNPESPEYETGFLTAMFN